MARTTFQGGPVDGGYVCLPFVFARILTNVASTVQQVQLPTGLQLKLVGVTVRASAVTSDPSFIIGNSTNTSGYVAATNATTNLGSVALGGALTTNGRANTTAGGRVIVTVATDTGDSCTNLCIDVWGHVIAHATNTENIGGD